MKAKKLIALGMAASKRRNGKRYRVQQENMVRRRHHGNAKDARRVP